MCNSMRAARRLPLVAAFGALAACSSAGRSPTPPPPPPAERPVEVAVEAWLTTPDRNSLLSRQPDAGFVAGRSSADWTITVDESRSYQEMVGFGAALTGSSAWLIHHKLTPAQREALLQDLFSTTEGVGFSFVRLPMGASDFSLEHYSYNDLPAGQADPELKRFSIAKDREYILPVLKQALAINPALKLMGSPWSPPGWMKTTGSLIKGRLKPEYYDAFAQYFVKYIEAYAAEGVPIWAITLQNEPHFEPENYPGMRVEPAERATIIGRHLGPLFERRGIRAQIWDWDHNWDEYHSPIAVLNDSVARRYIQGVAWHCYAGQVEAQNLVAAAHPDKEHLFTECSGGAWAPNFADNLKWTTQMLIVRSVRYGSRGVQMWNLALDPDGQPHLGGCGNCRGVVSIDQATGRVTRNEEYYAFGHASKFVRQGARRIDSATGRGGLESVAFKNPDGSKALLVVNTANLARNFAVEWGTRSFTYTLPAGAVVTFRCP